MAQSCHPDGISRIEVDGRLRPAVNSEGRPIHPTENGTRNFWRWFGDSRAVDEQGRPLVVYHGRHGIPHSLPDGIETFRPGNGEVGIGAAERSGSNLHGQGIWFSDSTRAASDYAGVEDSAQPVPMPEASIYPVFLNIRNPRRMGWREARGVSVQDVRAAGYDGVLIVENENWVALDARQIKSALGNSGAFDPRSPAIADQGVGMSMRRVIDLEQALRTAAAERPFHTMKP